VFERAGSLPVGGVGSFVVVDAFVEAVPEDFEPAVAQGAQAAWWDLPVVIFSS
jgi:hypothetical protein